VALVVQTWRFEWAWYCGCGSYDYYCYYYHGGSFDKKVLVTLCGSLATIQHAHLILMVMELTSLVVCQHYTAIKMEWETLFVRAL